MDPEINMGELEDLLAEAQAQVNDLMAEKDPAPSTAFAQQQPATKPLLPSLGAKRKASSDWGSVRTHFLGRIGINSAVKLFFAGPGRPAYQARRGSPDRSRGPFPSP